MEEPKKDARWMLVVSITMLILSVFPFSIVLYPRILFSNHHLDIWGQIAYVIISFFLVSVTSTTLYLTDFWKREMMYKLSVLLFTISMVLFLVIVNLRWLFPPI